MKNVKPILHKTLAITQLLIGCFIIYGNLHFAIPEIGRDLDFFPNYWSDFIFLETLKKFQFMTLIGLLLVIGSVQLLRSKKSGWIISLPTWITASIVMFYISFFKSLYSTELKGSEEIHIISFIILMIFFIPVIQLLSKYYIEKFHISKKDWMYVLGIFLFFVLNRLLIIPII